MSRIAIFGGGFDPITVSHIEVARLVQWVMDGFYFMPRQKKNSTAAEHRFAMCNLAIEDLLPPSARVFTSNFEIEKGIPHTYDLLDALARTSPQDEFYFICGQDVADTMDSWPCGCLIHSRFPCIVLPRYGHEAGPPQAVQWYRKGQHTFLEDAKIGYISSTAVRQMIAKDDPAAARWLAPSVMEYIKRNKLYVHGEV